MWIYLICIIEPLLNKSSMEVDVPGLKRVGRTIIATGGVSTPGLERLSNGDLLASFRRLTPGLTGAGFSSWRGEVLRSRDGGLTWSDPILQINGTPRRPGYHGPVLRNGPVGRWDDTVTCDGSDSWILYVALDG